MGSDVLSVSNALEVGRGSATISLLPNYRETVFVLDLYNTEGKVNPTRSKFGEYEADSRANPVSSYSTGWDEPSRANPVYSVS
jgi:hypothetical protein